MILGKHCPLCTYWGHRLFKAHGYWIRECQTCSHRWAEIGPSDGHIGREYGDAYFEGGGAGYSDYTSGGPLLIEHGRRYGRLLNTYLEPGTILDVGAAAGFILQGMLDTGWAGLGIDPNPKMAAYARNQLGLQVFPVPLEEYRTDMRFDVVSMIQVSHIFVDPKIALHHAKRLTKPDGCLLIETWNCRSWTAKMWGKHWHEYSPPSVLHWFSPATLRRFAKDHGFEEIVAGRPKKLISGAHIKSLVRFKTSALVLRPLRVLSSLIPDRLPVVYPAEDLFWALFRNKQ